MLLIMASVRRSLKCLPTHVSAKRRDQDVLLDDQEKEREQSWQLQDSMLLGEEADHVCGSAVNGSLPPAPAFNATARNPR